MAVYRPCLGDLCEKLCLKLKFLDRINKINRIEFGKIIFMLDYLADIARGFKYNPLSLPPPRRVCDLRKGDRDIIARLVFHSGFLFKYRSRI